MYRTSTFSRPHRTSEIKTERPTSITFRSRAPLSRGPDRFLHEEAPLPTEPAMPFSRPDDGLLRHQRFGLQYSNRTFSKLYFFENPHFLR